MSSVSREHLRQLSDSQHLIAYFNKYLTNIDLLYLGRKPVVLVSAVPEKDTKKIFFRKTYIVPTGFDGKTESLKTRWGCFWFKEREGTQQVKTIKYFQTDELSFHSDTHLQWNEIISFPLEDVDFSYDRKKLTIRLTFRRGKAHNVRTLVFFNDSAQIDEEDAIRLANFEEPHWS